MPANHIKTLNFSGSFINARSIENVQDYHINTRTIVVNPSQENVLLGEHSRSIIPPFSSTILNDTVVKRAKNLILLQIVSRKNIGKIVFETGWDLLGNLTVQDPDPFPQDVPLWKSPQDTAAIIAIDPYFMTRQHGEPKNSEEFEVKVNFWYAPSLTDCAIHNLHDFIEIHTQVFGLGRMQKFQTDDFDTLYDDLLMAEGYTTVLPFCEVQDNQKYTYPWHQYYADTDCIWMAIEYHPKR